MKKKKELSEKQVLKYRAILEAYYYPTNVETFTQAAASYMSVTRTKNRHSANSQFHKIMNNPLAASLVAMVRAEGSAISQQMQREKQELYSQNVMSEPELLSYLSDAVRNDLPQTFKTFEDIPQSSIALATSIIKRENNSYKVIWFDKRHATALLAAYHRKIADALDNTPQEAQNGTVIILPGNNRLSNPEKYGLREGS